MSTFTDPLILLLMLSAFLLGVLCFPIWNEVRAYIGHRRRERMRRAWLASAERARELARLEMR